jgi:hypothetical protein
MGRPTKASRATGERVGRLVAGGMPPSSAARLLGISSSSHSRWMQRGAAVAHFDPGDIPRLERAFWAYRDEIERAVAEDEARLLRIVRSHATSGASDSWRAARWALERRHRTNWAEDRSAGQRSDVAPVEAPGDAPTLTHLLRAVGGAQPPQE